MSLLYEFFRWVLLPLRRVVYAVYFRRMTFSPRFQLMFFCKKLKRRNHITTNMKLCRKQKRVLALIIFLIIVAVIFLVIPPTEALIITFFGGIVVGLLNKLLFGTDEEELAKAIVEGQERVRERQEKKAKLSDHYQNLRKNALEKWLNLATNTVYYIDDFPKAMNYFYLNTWSIIRGTDEWQKWMMQHVYDKKGYPKLKFLFEKLKRYEEKHNKFVASVLDGIFKEVKEVLDTFPKLKEHGERTTNNYYYTRKVLFCIHNYNISLHPYPNELIDEEGRVIAKGDTKAIQKLNREIERIRIAHKEDFENIECSEEKDKDILNKIKRLVKKINYELLSGKSLKGKCDYCSLDSID